MPRRVQTPLSYLDAPLDELLGQTSHVRILRALTEYEHPVPPVELARVTRLDLSGLRRAIDRLATVGIVRSLGVGRGRVVAFNADHRLAPVLRALFEAERRQRQTLIESLQQVLESCAPTPVAAWLEGPHASGRDTSDDALRIGVLAPVRDRHRLADSLSLRLRDVEHAFDLTVEVVVRTRADLETLPAQQLSAIRQGLLLYGVPPLAEPTARAPGDSTDDHTAMRTSTHVALDRESLEIGKRLANAVAHDPRLIERAQRWVERRLPRASEAEGHALREWAHILSMPPHRISAFLRDPGERATRLRQTLPFLGVFDTPS